MTARREPSTPPTLPGYDPVRLLGMGGFADVFLYQQRMPRRLVAVKVLLAGHLGDEVRERFRAEADTMARLSHHPSIVTIHHAAVAGDGRPFLVMEHCSRPGLGERYRTERMGVAEVLRIGVRLASAVETAHRAGVLHRDIKPANVLITDFGWPALTDFGIAATTSWAAGTAVGMSIPWSPPELLAEHPAGDARGDVYSLAATVYSLLARRSPFEVPGAPNGAADLIPRIERGTPAPTGRGDVPEDLEELLRRAMDVDPGRRHHSAFAFARALQQVEAELLLPVTPLDLPDTMPADVQDGTLADSSADDVPPEAAEGEASQPTRLRPVLSVAPEPPATPSATPREDSGDVLAHWGAAAVSVAHAPAEPVAAAGSRRRRAVVGALAGVVVIGVLAVAAVQAFSPTPDDDVAAPTASPAGSPAVPAVRAVPAPVDLVGTTAGDGSVVFTWSNPEPEEGDRFVWGVVVPGQDATLAPVDEPTVTVPAVTGGPTCVEVALVRQDGRSSTRPAVACAEGSEAAEGS
ncbi:MAG: protein kinase, partial [Actinotalea sp.]|nr:protein kinase [Actinotalea sp.]